jgi:RNA recognition motif-containing protein
MTKKLYVGSIPYETTDAQLEELFSQAGKVESATAITDKYSGRGKGFGFVEMETEESAQKAIQTLNGYNLEGRTIVVNEARPKEDRVNRGNYTPRPTSRRW